MELAARIGQTLLEKNKVYEEKNETLEDLLSQANERVGKSVFVCVCVGGGVVKRYRMGGLGATSRRFEVSHPYQTNLTGEE